VNCRHEDLSPEGRAIYDIHKTESDAAYKERYLAHKKEVLDGIRGLVANTNKQLKGLKNHIYDVQHSMESEISEVTATFHTDLETVWLQLGGELAHLSNSVDRAFHTAATTSTAQQWVGNLANGPSGHRGEPQHQGMACAHGTPPPAGGMHVFPTHPPNSTHQGPPINSDALVSAPRVELPQFDGSNSKLWQHCCEEYFHKWDTPSSSWISYALS
jgi:hypothetical protein